jgi:hypothetical protein
MMPSDDELWEDGAELAWKITDFDLTSEEITDAAMPLADLFLILKWRKEHA